MTPYEQMVYLWATRYWPDVAFTWEQYREYYSMEFVKAQVRESQRQAVAAR